MRNASDFKNIFVNILFKSKIAQIWTAFYFRTANITLVKFTVKWRFYGVYANLASNAPSPLRVDFGCLLRDTPKTPAKNPDGFSRPKPFAFRSVYTTSYACGRDKVSTVAEKIPAGFFYLLEPRLPFFSRPPPCSLSMLNSISTFFFADCKSEKWRRISFRIW